MQKNIRTKPAFLKISTKRAYLSYDKCYVRLTNTNYYNHSFVQSFTYHFMQTKKMVGQQIHRKSNSLSRFDKKKKKNVNWYLY